MTRRSSKMPVATTAITKSPSSSSSSGSGGKESKEHLLPPSFSLQQAREAISTIITHVQKSKQNTLFEDAPTRINLDVSALKIPEGLTHFVNINLPHSPYPVNPDILFVIPDDKRNNTEAEQLVHRMKDKLADKAPGLPIREVMTLTQLKHEYSTHEAKRELAKRIDVVIAMKSVHNLLPSILGREFYKKKKVALMLELHDSDDDWPALFEATLKRTVFNISLVGKTSTLVIGHTDLSVDQLTDNVSKIVNWLMRLFPGGWENVGQLALTIPAIPPLLIYFGTGTIADVTKPVVTRGRKVNEVVEGELSTLVGRRRVKVGPYGSIEVVKKEEEDDEDEDSDQMSDDDEEEEEEEEEAAVKEEAMARKEEEPATDQLSKDTRAREEKKKKRKLQPSSSAAEEKFLETVYKRQEFEEVELQKQQEEQEQKKKKKQKRGKGSDEVKNKTSSGSGPAKKARNEVQMVSSSSSPGKGKNQKKKAARAKDAKAAIAQQGTINTKVGKTKAK